LKSAAVIGNVFSFKQLRCVCDSLDEHHLMQIGAQLEELENRDVIELLFEDGYGDKIYRFTHTFMRETLYSE
jgi:predicted ATPase